MAKVFYDCEFTGLHKDTTLISIGMVSDNGKSFYAEATDYDESQVDDFLRENILPYLLFEEEQPFARQFGSQTFVRGNKEDIGLALGEWFKQFKQVELWSDCHHYDVVLLHDIFGGAFSMPDNVYYIPFDICTYFKLLGIDPDVSREAFIDRPIEGSKHNSLYDAKVIEACYEKLQRNKEAYLKNLTKK